MIDYEFQLGHGQLARIVFQLALRMSLDQIDEAVA